MAVDIYAQVQETRASYTNAWCRQILQERLLLWHLMEEHAIKDHMITLRLDDERKNS